MFAKNVSRTMYYLKLKMEKYTKQLAKIAGIQPCLTRWLPKKRKKEMNDKEFEKLILKLRQRDMESNELKVLFFTETGSNYIPPFCLAPVVPECPECGKAMQRVEPGTYKCDCKKGE